MHAECWLGGLMEISFGRHRKDARGRFSNSEFREGLILAVEDNDRTASGVRLRTVEFRGHCEDSPCDVWWQKRHGIVSSKHSLC
jgi:hypothetical protein